MDEDEQREQEERDQGAVLLAWLQRETEKKQRINEAIQAGLAAREDDLKEDDDGDE